MRNLTVRRNKTFVGCAAKIQIYIEDMNSTETIGGIPCRLLGVLKNGESATFPIEDSACKIIASFRGPGKNQFYDYYKLPEGTEDWYLSGKCQFNPGAGNAFLFDNVTDEEILAHRQVKGKKSIFITIGAIILGVAVGLGFAFLGNSDSCAKTFKTGEFSITLNEDYKMSYPAEYEYECNYLYESDYALVLITKDPFMYTSGLEYYTLDLYAELLASYNEQENWNTKSADDFIYYEYENEVDNETFSGMLTIYKTSDAFWVIEYITPTENYKELKSDFLKFAESVEFTK